MMNLKEISFELGKKSKKYVKPRKQVSKVRAYVVEVVQVGNNNRTCIVESYAFFLLKKKTNSYILSKEGDK